MNRGYESVHFSPARVCSLEYAVGIAVCEGMGSLDERRTGSLYWRSGVRSLHWIGVLRAQGPRKLRQTR